MQVGHIDPAGCSVEAPPAYWLETKLPCGERVAFPVRMESLRGTEGNQPSN